MTVFTSGACPVCTSSKFAVVGATDLGQRISCATPPQIARCSQCSSYFAEPLPIWSPSDFQLLYDGNYFSQVAGGTPDDDESILRLRNVEFRYQKIVDHLACVPTSALEIGAGIQAFMAAHLTSVGWSNVVVQEPSVELAQKLSDRYPKLRVITSDFISDASASYSLFYADSVLEHVPNPRDYVTKISQILEPGGIAYCVVPAEDSLFNFVKNLLFKIRRSKKVSQLCPYADSYHLIGFSEQGLRHMAAEAGLELVFYLRGRDDSWSRVLKNRRLRSPLVRYFIATVLNAADKIGWGRNQEFMLQKPSAKAAVMASPVRHSTP
jgi:SAM-dependent methyltransferase